MPEKRRKFDREFGEGAVRIVRETNKPTSEDVDSAGEAASHWSQSRCSIRTGWSPRPASNHQLTASIQIITGLSVRW